jgi:hypothetical protein
MRGLEPARDTFGCNYAVYVKRLGHAFEFLRAKVLKIES